MMGFQLTTLFLTATELDCGQMNQIHPKEIVIDQELSMRNENSLQ